MSLMDNYTTPIPSWNAQKWLKEWLPIWNRRIRFEQHLFRAAYYQEHIKIVENRCYISQSGKEVHIPWDAYEMMNSSKLYSCELHPAPPEKIYQTVFEVRKMDCLDAAKEAGLNITLNTGCQRRKRAILLTEISAAYGAKALLFFADVSFKAIRCLTNRGKPTLLRLRRSTILQ